MDDGSEHTLDFISKLNVNTDERLVFVNESGQCRRHCRADRYNCTGGPRVYAEQENADFAGDMTCSIACGLNTFE